MASNTQLLNLFMLRFPETQENSRSWKTRSVKVRTEVSWFNDDIRTARKICRQLERKWRKNGKLEIQRQKYRKPMLKSQEFNQPGKDHPLFISSTRILRRSKEAVQDN